MPITYVKADVRSNCKMKKKNPLQNENKIGFLSSEVRKLFSFIIIFKILISCSPCSFISLFIHQFICSFIGHSVHPSVCPSISQSVHPLICLFIHQSASSSIYLLILQSVYSFMSVHPSGCLFNHQSVCSYNGLFMYKSISKSPNLSVHLSVYQSACVFIAQFFHSSICLLIHQFLCSFNGLSVHPLVFLFIHLSALYLVTFITPIKSVLRGISTPHKCGVFCCMHLLLILGKVVNYNIPQCTILCLLENF